MSNSSAGRWLFRNRGWLPVPLLLAMLSMKPRFWLPGAMVLGTGEFLRLWAVGHIGRKSRTRGEDVGDLASTGPYARLRNPLYLGNLLIFTGLGIILWPWALVVLPLMGLYYDRIVAWEEENLRRHLGQPYQDYLLRVPRWGWGKTQAVPGSWNGAEALRSERSTLLALFVVLLLVWLRGSWTGP